MRIARRIVVALVTGLFLVSISSHLTWAAQGSGGLDPTFGVRGKVLTDFGGGSFESAKALAIQSDGKIVVAGISNAGAPGGLCPGPVHSVSQDPTPAMRAISTFCKRGRHLWRWTGAERP